MLVTRTHKQLVNSLMTQKSKTTQRKNANGKLLAASAAALLAAGGGHALAADPPIDTTPGKCWGVNSCKGSSACKTLTSSCAGKNSCKAAGFLIMPQSECNDFAGDWEAIDPNNPPKTDARGLSTS